MEADHNQACRPAWSVEPHTRPVTGDINWAEPAPRPAQQPTGIVATERSSCAHAAITTQLLNRARDAANARAEAEEQLEHRPQAKARTQLKRPGAVGWVVALSRRVRALAAGTT